MTYARGTQVAVGKSEMDIKRLIQKAGGTRVASFEEEGRAIILFELKDRRIRFELPLPTLTEYALTDGGRVAAKNVQENRWAAACRERWRALLLCIKAKLVSVESGVETLEEAFLAQLVTPDGQPFGRVAIPQLEASYVTGKLPPLLPG